MNVNENIALLTNPCSCDVFKSPAQLRHKAPAQQGASMIHHGAVPRSVHSYYLKNQAEGVVAPLVEQWVRIAHSKTPRPPRHST